MKKLLFAFMLFVATATVFTACKKDDDDNGGASIVGTWHLKKGVEYNLVDGKLHGEKIEEDLSDENYSITFNANGTFSTQVKVTYMSTDSETTEGVHTEEGTYVYTNGQLTLKYDDEDEPDVSKATVTANSLVLVYEDADVVNGRSIAEVIEEHYTR